MMNTPVLLATQNADRKLMLNRNLPLHHQPSVTEERTGHGLLSEVCRRLVHRVGGPEHLA